MSGANVPRVSLQRTFTILILIYGVALLLALLAGGTLLAHVNPYGECLLYASPDRRGALYYGSEYICDGIGGFFIITMFGAVIMSYFTFKHRRELVSLYDSGEMTKGEKALTISKSTIMAHAAITGLVVILTIATTAGYQSACSSIERKLRGALNEKLNEDPNETRGQNVDERFTDDNQFWRYAGKIGNPFGSELYEVRMTCRTVFTDPTVHQELHDNHVAKFGNYFGYWYKDDLFSYNSQLQSVLTNTLIEASLAGAWMSVLVWAGALVFMVVQKYYIQREKWASDKLSLHSGMEGGSVRGSIRKYEGSMMSGYYSGHQSTLSRPGTSTLQRGQGMRGSMDNLALGMAGAPQQTYLSEPQQTYPADPQQTYLSEPQQSYIQPQGYPGYPQQMGAPGLHFQLQQQEPLQHQGYVDRSEVETEIM